jgi:hypothetical protein
MTFMPTAAVIGVQLSVFVMGWLLVLVVRAVEADSSPIVPRVDIDTPITARA